MEISIRNIGKIKEANILLDGITVIAGENNTGKSTVGKALFCFFYQMNRWHSIHRKKCSERILPIAEKYVDRLKNLFAEEVMPTNSKIQNLLNTFFSKDDFIRRLIDEQKKLQKNPSPVVEGNPLMRDLDHFVQNYLQLYLGVNFDCKIKEKNDVIYKWKKSLISELCNNTVLINEFLQADYIEESFKKVFNNQHISCRLKDGSASVALNIEGKFFKLNMGIAGAILTESFSIENRIFFIESPTVYDRIAMESVVGKEKGNRYQLEKILFPNYELMKNDRKTYKVLPDDSEKDYNWTLKERENAEILFEIIRSALEGRSSWSSDGFKYVNEGEGVSLYPHNVSQGIKHLAFLEYIIREKLIHKGDILVLDEPEINLHPEWQVIYARVLVAMEKYFGVKLVITSHSPYFIRAIECFSDIYERMENLNIYWAKIDKDNNAYFENVMDSEWGLSELYENFSVQYDKLQEELNKKYRS